jgi:hypothetical protein
MSSEIEASIIFPTPPVGQESQIGMTVWYKLMTRDEALVYDKMSEVNSLGDVPDTEWKDRLTKDLSEHKAEMAWIYAWQHDTYSHCPLVLFANGNIGCIEDTGQKLPSVLQNPKRPE